MKKALHELKKERDLLVEEASGAHPLQPSGFDRSFERCDASLCSAASIAESALSTGSTLVPSREVPAELSRALFRCKQDFSNCEVA